jgi:hypothetical protein
MGVKALRSQVTTTPGWFEEYRGLGALGGPRKGEEIANIKVAGGSLLSLAQ